jgi:hypothetical protein
MTEKSDAGKIEYRPMVLDDDSYVYDILEAVAPEIPFQLDSLPIRFTHTSTSASVFS